MAKKPRAVAKKSVPPRPSKPPEASIHPTEVVEFSTLRPHPENYKSHPDEQLDHIAASIRQHGYYRNVVVARDGTILAGHGVVEAATKKLGLKRGPVVRLPIAFDSPAALKVLALDNELPKFGETDDRKLSEILRRIRDEGDGGLLGTGYDDQKLAALLKASSPPVVPEPPRTTPPPGDSTLDPGGMHLVRKCPRCTFEF